MRWFIATWLLTLRVFAADPFFEAQFQALAQFNPYYVGGLVGDWSWASPGQYLLNGTGISVTYDRSGQGNNLTNGTAASQPLISRTDNAGNLLVRSEEFQTTWSKARVNGFTATDTGAIGAGSFANTARTLDPLGANNADFIQEDGTAAGSHYIYQLVTCQLGSSYSVSIYAKPAGRTWLYISASDNGANRCSAYFDLQNIATGTVANGGTGSGATATISASANGFVLCTLTGSPATTGSTLRLELRLASGDNGDVYNGDNTSGIFLWGASLHQSDWSTNYVQTTSTIALPGLNGLATAYFDGVDDFLKSAAFTLNQPTFVVMVAKQVTWTALDALFDGSALNTGRLMQSGASPTLRMKAGTDGATTADLTIGNWGIVSIGFNGASSFLRYNNGAVSTADAGAGNMGLFVLGNAGAGSLYSNIQVARVLVYNRIPSAAEQDYIVRGLAVQYGLNP